MGYSPPTFVAADNRRVLVLGADAPFVTGSTGGDSYVDIGTSQICTWFDISTFDEVGILYKGDAADSDSLEISISDATGSDVNVLGSGTLNNATWRSLTASIVTTSSAQKYLRIRRDGSYNDILVRAAAVIRGA